MAEPEVTVVQLCGECMTEIGTYDVKKENMILRSRELVWCAKCEAYRPEIREVAGRSSSIRQEQESYPPNTSIGDRQTTP
jgi:hypothetical protein